MPYALISLFPHIISFSRKFRFFYINFVRPQKTWLHKSIVHITQNNIKKKEKNLFDLFHMSKKWMKNENMKWKGKKMTHFLTECFMLTKMKKERFTEEKMREILQHNTSSETCEAMCERFVSDKIRLLRWSITRWPNGRCPVDSLSFFFFRI